MINTKVQTLLKNALSERNDLFLIDVNISLDNVIKIVIDGDNGVLVEDCIFISRAIEHNLDRDTEDFSIEVLSAGATSPLVQPRQYQKHIGRILEITTNNDTKHEGKLMVATQEHIKIEWKTRQPKPIGKGKVTVTKQEEITINSIKEAKVKITF